VISNNLAIPLDYPFTKSMDERNILQILDTCELWLDPFSQLTSLLVFYILFSMILDICYSRGRWVSSEKIPKCIVLHINTIVRLAGFYVLHQVYTREYKWFSGFSDGFDCYSYNLFVIQSHLYISLMLWETIYMKHLTPTLFIHHVVVILAFLPWIHEEINFYGFTLGTGYRPTSLAWWSFQGANYAGYNCALWLFYFHFEVPLNQLICTAISAFFKLMTTLYLSVALCYVYLYAENFKPAEIFYFTVLLIAGWLAECRMSYVLIKLTGKKYEEWYSGVELSSNSLAGGMLGISKKDPSMERKPKPKKS